MSEYLIDLLNEIVEMHKEQRIVLTANMTELERQLAELSAQQPISSTVDDLHKFLNAAAGEGFELDGVDASDLYISLFPQKYAEALSQKGGV